MGLRGLLGELVSHKGNPRPRSRPGSDIPQKRVDDHRRTGEDSVMTQRIPLTRFWKSSLKHVL